MLIFALIGIVLVGSLAAGLGYLWISRHAARSRLENYGRPPGMKPLEAFVCPTCLHRSYAPQHVRDRYCVKCETAHAGEPEAQGETAKARA